MPTTESVVAATGTFGMATWAYNKENFFFDAEQRFARYTVGYNFANEQVGMYRDDIDDLTELTSGKMNGAHSVAALTMVILIQLIMAGRLGVHGPAPPGWLMGMYWVSTGLCFMFIVLTHWLSMHASARCVAGMAYMKTRSVRLPIPTPKQLDKARVFANSFEKQRVADSLRVPFIMPVPHDDPIEAASDSEVMSVKSSGSNKSRKTRGPLTDPRTPAWAHEEMHALYDGLGGPSTIGTPEHFELYRGLQHEWWAHDVYARICIFLAFSHWLHGGSLYIMSHCYIELRAMWPAYSCTAMLVACQVGIFRLDILSELPQGMFSLNIPVEYICPYTPVVSSILMWLEYSSMPPQEGVKIFIQIVSFFLYFIHLAWAIRLLQLCWPNQTPEMPDDSPGQPWWPAEWYLPMAFSHANYVVTAPKQLAPGESCLWQEMKGSKKAKTGLTQPLAAREAESMMFPWKIVRGGLITAIIVWVFIICGRVVECVNGERELLKQEGRIMRWPSHMQPWITPWTREGTRQEWCHTGGCDRRLDARQGRLDAKHNRFVADYLDRLLPVLHDISDSLQQEPAPIRAQPAAQVHTGPVERMAVDWPADLKPTVLACGPDSHVAAVARGHSGAILPSLLVNAAAAGAAEAFSLAGVEDFGEVLGAHWHHDGRGLLVTTTRGTVLECPGVPLRGAWSCRPLGMPLPLGGSSLRQAVAARGAEEKLHAAAVYEGENSVVLFEADLGSGTWITRGEAQLPTFMDEVPSLTISSTAGELMLSMQGGGVLKWAFTESEPSIVAMPPTSTETSGMVWQSACALGSPAPSGGANGVGHLARLALRQQASAWSPEVFVSKSV
mmetsp:Transcript_120092/g.207648  ORF Transcript_120092/g.207648 Transcript_120092/m.207648 type:complete len:839 (-) Transcript_120092:126-2642(-)